MTAPTLIDLIDYYESNISNKKFHHSITSRLDQWELSELKEQVFEYINHIDFKPDESTLNYSNNLVRYSLSITHYYEQKRVELLQYSLGIAGFCISYIALAFTVKDDFLLTSVISPFIMLVSCGLTWIVYMITINPNYSHRDLGNSPYYYKYNIGKLYKPRYLNINFLKKKEDNLSDKIFFMDLLNYTKSMETVITDKNKIILSDIEQIIMLFSLTAHKSKYLKLMRNILFTGLIITLLCFVWLLIKA